MSILLDGYTIAEQIYDGAKTVVYRGERIDDGRKVIIKCLKQQYPSLAELAQYRNQYIITNNLHLQGAIAPYSLETWGNGLALVMEDYGGINLLDYLKQKNCSRLSGQYLSEFLSIALQLAKTLEQLDRNKIIHQKIQPSSILINPDTKQVKLSDFSIATSIAQNHVNWQQLQLTEDVLPYISPEQTGRMNRGVDHRTDFYSLGVTFYQLLTGKLPFVATDTLELVHCHMAIAPAPLPEIAPDIPEVISALVLKLMAKNPEQRYQTALGLSWDLTHCQKQWQARGQIENFVLGRRDIGDRLIIPDRLYGREQELKTLLAMYDRISQGSKEIAIVTGMAGIGKTALIEQFSRSLVGQQVYLIKGRWEQFQQKRLFSGIIWAVRSLICQLQTESPQSLQHWRAQLLEAVGKNGQVIVDVIPELTKIIGEQPPVAELAPSAAQNRFNVTFTKFIQALATREHSLIIFLDDLQWADLASLKFLWQLINAPDTSNLLIIGAYRHEEINSVHPLAVKLKEIEQNVAELSLSSVAINYLNLLPLNYLALNGMIADTFFCTETAALPFSELLWQKTQGNPFFAIQLLQYWHQLKLISFNRGRGCWQCDLAQVKLLSISDNLVEFMAHRLQQLPSQTQKILKIAACIGNQFDLNTLAIAYGQSERDTAKEMRTALQEGLILPVNEIYQFDFAPPSSTTIKPAAEPLVYQFVHERVQQAAYGLISADERAGTHYQIGQLLLNKISWQESDTQIFAIVDHLNTAINLLESSSQREKLAQLNLKAGIKAKNATAYNYALNYFSTGFKLLQSNCWQTQYEISLALSIAAAEVNYLCGNLEAMERLVATVVQQGRTIDDCLQAYEVQIQAYIALGEPLKAVNIALGVLRLLGVYLPLEPTKFKILWSLVTTKLITAGKELDHLIALPVMSDPNSLAVMRLISLVGFSAHNSVPNLAPLLASKAVNLSIRQGNTALSIYGYASYGASLCGTLGQIDIGYQYGELALKLLEKLSAKELEAKTLTVFNNYIRHWKEHPREGLASLKLAFASGLETGDLEFAAYAIFVYCYHSYLSGRELTELEQEIATASKSLSQLNQANTLNLVKLYRQIILNLLGKTEYSDRLLGDEYHEDKILPQLIATDNLAAIAHLYCHKLILSYLFGNYSVAVNYAEQTKQYLAGVQATLIFPLFYFYDSLAKLASYEDYCNYGQRDLLQQVKNNQKKMQKWADHAPMNYLHKFYLVEAEKFRVLGNNILAMENYDRAVQLAKFNQYTNEHALAQELAAKFYLTIAKSTIAQLYLTKAYYSYACWGAQAKVEHLRQQYPQLLNPAIDRTLNSAAQPDKRAITAAQSCLNNLDIKTIIKTSQAISKEVKLDKLLATLMKLSTKNSGANKGSLILFDQKKQEKILVEVNIVGQESQVKINRCSLNKLKQNLPTSIINYVKITSKSIVLDRATNDSTFVADPYIINHAPQSILCMPILNKNKLLGILYLENKLTQSVFTRARLEILNILCSQAVISLENANLYLNLRRSSIRETNKANQLAKSLQQLQASQQELLQVKQQLEHDAFHDSLTGLPNRACLLKLLEKSINLAARHPNYLYAFMFLDLDRFKVINDSLGHLIGDELLKQVAQRLRICLRATDTVSRLGGDEFAILLEEIIDVEEVKAIAERIQDQFAQPFYLNGREVYAGTSIGITFSHFNYQNPEDLMRDADAAMYEAKSQGKGRYLVFDPTMQTKVMAGLKLENALRQAISRNELCLYYQPIISATTGILIGFEALIRWNHPTKGLMLPAEFIPKAEETGLIDNIGWWVITAACEQLRQWRDRFPQQKIVVNVNFSTVQLKQDNILQRLQEICRQTQLPDLSLKLEITESCILETFTAEAKTLMKLKDLGIGLCIDDFGTGYSSLSRLHEFPIDTLKIDRSFVSRLGEDSQHNETVKTIVALAHSLKMDVVAEGVETTNQLNQLRQLNCESLQGYLFSKPLDSATATKLLERDNLSILN